MEMRNQRIKEFEELLRVCERDPELMKSIELTRRNILVERDAMLEQKVERLAIEEPTKEWMANPLCNIGVLSLFHLPHPEGNVIRGGEGWVETLCRTTTLYPCLLTESLHQSFFQCYSDGFQRAERCIYIPGVMCLKKTEDSLELLCSEQRFLMDVIGYGYTEEIEIGKSMDEMFRCAAEQQLTDLVVSVSQYCGLGCRKEEVFERMKTALQKYSHFFRAVHLVL